MNKIIVFLLMILICFSSFSFAIEQKDSQEKSNFNWGGLIFAIICLGLLIGLVAVLTKDGEDYIQDVEQFNRSKRAARANTRFK